jgi:hypothetical protein
MFLKKCIIVALTMFYLLHLMLLLIPVTLTLVSYAIRIFQETPENLICLSQIGQLCLLVVGKNLSPKK